MSKRQWFIAKFDDHSEYESFTGTSEFTLPNVSLCEQENEVHYNPLVCEESTTYEVSNVSYPSEVDGNDTSFEMSFNYKKTCITTDCIETVTEGSDTVTVEIGENPSTADSRTVKGTYDYHGTSISYTVTQTPAKVKVEIIGKFNVTDTSSATKILNGTTGVSEVYIDGIKQDSVTTGYTFSATGEHTVKYTLTGTSIGDSAFYNCSGLTEITMPDSVTYINRQAFSGCTSLSSVTIGNGVTGIGQSAFDRCSGLTEVTIPNSVTSIGQQAFYGCSGLTEVTIGSGVTEIGEATFSRCASLTSITCYRMAAPTIISNTFFMIKTGGTLYVPQGSTGYNVWMYRDDYYLGSYNWTMV